MENPDNKEFRKILRRHEEVTQANSRVLMLISSKLEELEQASNLHNANVMVLILQQKRRFDSLVAECNILCILVATSHMEALSLTSNNLDSVMHETVNQVWDPMGIEEQSSHHLDGTEEAQGSVQP
jgi:hypothetical protein